MMTHTDKHDSRAFEGRFVIGVSVLFLALAVFGWGLHSKLSLYHVRVRTSAHTPVAKLLSERERPVDQEQQSAANHPELHAVEPTALVVLLPHPVVQILPRGDAPPPAPRVVALKGPSLRRPPPSPVA